MPASPRVAVQPWAGAGGGAPGWNQLSEEGGTGEPGREKNLFLLREQITANTFFQGAKDYVQCCAAACAAAMQLMVWPAPVQRK